MATVPSCISFFFLDQRVPFFLLLLWLGSATKLLLYLVTDREHLVKLGSFSSHCTFFLSTKCLSISLSLSLLRRCSHLTLLLLRWPQDAIVCFSTLTLLSCNGKRLHSRLFSCLIRLKSKSLAILDRLEALLWCLYDILINALMLLLILLLLLLFLISSHLLILPLHLIVLVPKSHRQRHWVV